MALTEIIRHYKGNQKYLPPYLQPLKENGMFSEIYGALSKMDGDIHRADQISEETETTRREWIANITHDLKTPLFPIKGYAELLADDSVCLDCFINT